MKELIVLYSDTYRATVFKILLLVYIVIRRVEKQELLIARERAHRIYVSH
jgi:hypothetical protein